MSQIIIARPRHDYASYRDLWALVQLSGFPLIYYDEIDPQSDNAYVLTVLNDEVPKGGYPDARAKLALWDLEWHMDGVPALANVEYWAGDKWYAERIGARYIPMGSHPALCPEPTSKEDIYDVAFIGYFDGVPRRQIIRNQLIAVGLNVSPPLAWGAERHAILRNSAAYLHVHQLENAPAIPPLRMVIAAAYALPVITETCADAGIFAKHVVQSDYRHIAANALLWTRAEWQQELLPRAMSLRQKLCIDMTFRKSVERAI